MKEHKRIKLHSIIASSVIIILFACVLIAAYAMTKAAPAATPAIARMDPVQNKPSRIW